ncbi:putative Rab-GTPase-TBC domain containing protein [Leishmania utingensis]|uniref:Rab-GTPase-TBC domain containing protein n=1 Tax=Leishmania utingensis TaxID=653362 RepID=A0AAW3A843_9TRYP
MQTSSEVAERSASTPSSHCTSALHSAARRSVTVALDQHPLASAHTVVAAEPRWADSHVRPSSATTEEGTDDSFDKCPATLPLVRAHDTGSVSHAADEEMKLMDDFGSGGGIAFACVATAEAAVSVVRDTGPTPVTKMLWSSSQQPVTAGHGNSPVIVSVRQVSSAIGNGVCVPYRNNSRVGLATASTSSSLPNNEKAAQPKPYPVTSASSLQDWSSLPRLGFPAPRDPAVVHAEAVSQSVRDRKERKREDKWNRRCRGVSLLASASPDVIVKLRAVAREYGIPHHLRSVMWLTLTGMALKVDENEYFCAKLLRRNGYVTGSNADAIAADVQRTFPDHPYFSDQDIGTYKLTNVLHALCWRNPLLSYCQSFNFLAAFLLLVLDDEERAFWLLVHIFEELLPNDFYGETLLGANVEQAVLEYLVEKQLPRVAAKFREAGLQVKVLVANWIMSLFVNVFPIETTLHVWDYVFCRTPSPGERTPAHLEITLATLKYLDDASLLSSGDAGELLVSLRKHTACLFDAEALVRLAQSMTIAPAQLHQLRRQCKPAVVQQMKAREQARVVQQERRVAQELLSVRQKALTSANDL